MLERGAKTVLIRPAPVPGLPGVAVVRLRGVRPVLAARSSGRRHPGVDARLGQRLLALPERLDRPAGDAAVPARRVPHDDPRQAADRGHDVARWSATACSTRFPDLKIAAIENGGDWVVRLPRAPRGHLPQDAPRLRRGPDRRRSSATSTSARSTRTRSAGSSRPSASDHVLFGSDYPAPGGPGRALHATSTTCLPGLSDEDLAASWAATSASSCGSAPPSDLRGSRAPHRVRRWALRISRRVRR